MCLKDKNFYQRKITAIYLLQEYFCSQALVQMCRTAPCCLEDPISQTSKLKMCTAGISGSSFLSNFLILLPVRLLFSVLCCKDLLSNEISFISWSTLCKYKKSHFRWYMQSWSFDLLLYLLFMWDDTESIWKFSLMHMLMWDNYMWFINPEKW